LSVGGTYSINGKIKNEINSPASYSLFSSPNEPIPTSRNDVYAAHLNVSRDAANRWTQNNPITNGYPRLIDSRGERIFLDDYMTTRSDITNGALLESVSYFKIGSVALSYTFKENIVKKMGLTSIGIMVSANNLFTFTNYSGIDPESPGATYPMARTISAGINIGF
jgi:TonB dependent receptor.